MAHVTALRERPRGRVAVELDDREWRTLPVAAVAAAGLRVGLELDRARARELRRALRRTEALATASRALRHRDHSRASLVGRLEAAGVAPSARADALAALEGSGVVDDARAAAARGEALAERGYGDAAIRADLERRGFALEAVDEAIAALAPELERARAVVARRGASPATARRLLARGFDPDAAEAAVAEGAAGAVG